MGNPTRVFVVWGILLLGAGCASVDPRTVPQTVHDLSHYSFPAADGFSETNLVRLGRSRVAVVVDVSRASARVVNTSRLEDTLKLEIDKDLRAHEFLNVIPAPKAVTDFANGGFRDGGDAAKAHFDYVLLASVAAVGTAIDTTQLSRIDELMQKVSSAPSEPRYHADVIIDFKVYDLVAGGVTHSETVSKVRSGVERSNIENVIMQLSSDAVQDFSKQLIGEIGPVGRVLKTTGDGRYALIELGRSSGIVPGGQVQILKREETVQEHKAFRGLLKTRQ